MVVLVPRVFDICRALSCFLSAIASEDCANNGIFSIHVPDRIRIFTHTSLSIICTYTTALCRDAVRNMLFVRVISDSIFVSLLARFEVHADASRTHFRLTYPTLNHRCGFIAGLFGWGVCRMSSRQCIGARGSLGPSRGCFPARSISSCLAVSSHFLYAQNI